MKNFKSSGFTLIELIIVIVILGTLTGIAVPAVYSHVKQAKVNTALANLEIVKNIEADIFNKTGYVTGSSATENNTDYITATEASINSRLGNKTMNDMHIKVLSAYLGNGTDTYREIILGIDYAAAGLDYKDFYKDAATSTPFPGLTIAPPGRGQPYQVYTDIILAN